MTFELKDGHGSLFKNGYKQKESHPDTKGEVKIDGELYELAGWKKKTKSGDDYLSLTIKPKGERPKKSREPGEDDDKELNDDIPW